MVCPGLIVIAGMATGIGSVIAFTVERTNYHFLSIATGFSAGAILYVAFGEIFFKGVEALTDRYGDYRGPWIRVAAFFGGMLLSARLTIRFPPPRIRTRRFRKRKPGRCT